MPWGETTPMTERVRFWRDYQRGIFGFKELCEVYGISRKTGYKLVRRILEGGLEGSVWDRSRAPRSCPHRTDEALEDALVEIRRAHPTWGPKKIVGYLRTHVSQSGWPAPSTVGDILKRRGMVQPRRRRPRPGHPGRGQTRASEPNAVWTGDFKGHFRTRDGLYCYPLTVVDGFSRYLLGCQSLPSTEHDGAQPVFERLFREFGLPKVIRTDNGVPFATQAVRRLSSLSVWWIKIGISPELNEPSHPEQNGSHERMHRVLKAEATKPPTANCRTQQKAFDRFRADYNNERPHEALDQKTPASVYRASPRSYPDKIPAIEYPEHFEVRRVSRNGGIRWHHSSATGPNNGWVNISHVLAEESVGLDEVDDGIWSVYFGPVLLGRFDERELRLYGDLNKLRTR
jgi:transposase InsO family protein